MSLGIYVHVPFCMSKCPYCDFYSVVTRDEDMKERFTERLVREIKESSTYRTPYRSGPDTLYFGGGIRAPLILRNSRN